MIGIVVGLAAEARLARGFQAPVEIGGGGPAGALDAAARLVRAGCTALVSFGLAGGLAPDFEAGDIIVPQDIVSDAGERWEAAPALAARLGSPAGTLLAGTAIIAAMAAKRAAWQRTGAVAVDLESGAVARAAALHGLAFAALRAVCDPSGRDLPPASLTAVSADGRIRPTALLRSLARHPGQIPALIALGRDAARARAALLAQVAEIGRLNG